MYSEVSFLCSLSISRIDFVRFRILMSTVSSFVRHSPASVAQELHFVEWVTREHASSPSASTSSCSAGSGGATFLNNPSLASSQSITN